MRALPPAVALLLAVPVAAAGSITGVAVLALHTRWWGLVLGVLATVLALVALPRGWWSRPPFALGWLVPVLTVGLRTGPGGDVVVRADPAGYTVLVLGLVMVVAVLLTLPGRQSRDAPDSDDVRSAT